jgi:tRNA (guanine9-N1)-methyltransferase
MLLPCALQGTMAAAMKARVPGLEHWHATLHEGSYIDVFAPQREQLVYLTADSPNELTDLDPGRAYIIGGIVDRNRHKGICFEKAQAQGIATAQLSVGEHLKKAASKVCVSGWVEEVGMCRYG